LKDHNKNNIFFNEKLNDKKEKKGKNGSKNPGGS